MGKTMFDKIWDAHIVRDVHNEPAVLYVDYHLVHEATSPQAFEGLRMRGIGVRCPKATLAIVDHNIPTVRGRQIIDVVDNASMLCITTLEQNAREFGIPLFSMNNPYQGIVHVIGPELGLTLPGMTIVCGDSHTSTHGALGVFAMGIGTSEVEHVLATQCFLQTKPRTMCVQIEGKLQKGVTAKDIALAFIKEFGTGVGISHVIEFCGSAIQNLSMEGRMTLCNMAIEAGARAGMVAPDDITFNYIKGRHFAPQGQEFEQAVESWRKLASDSDAHFDKKLTFSVDGLAPQVSWGTHPGMVVGISDQVPDPATVEDERTRHEYQKALTYMGLKPGQNITDIKIDTVFIGSCTNSRLEDLRMAAQLVKGKRIAPNVRAIVVPGSMQIHKQAEEEGLAAIFQEAGFEWREAGCSMCIAMNGDRLSAGERCASTGNRNFEGRQGAGGRTHLVSPAMAAAAAVAGYFTDIRDLF